MTDSISQNGRSGENLEHRVEVFGSEETVSTRSGDVERRAKPRVNEPFPTRCWGVDSGDLPFNVDCVLDNLSSTGLYLRVPRPMTLGCEVRLIVHLLSGPTTGATATIAGEVVRDEPQRDGSHGLAVAIKNYKFL